MAEHRVSLIERFVRDEMSNFAVSDFRIGHDFKHVDRVRHWALEIAEHEGYNDSELVEAAALLHDIGLTKVKKRGQHASVGAEMATRFLHQEQLFSDMELNVVADAIRCHSSPNGGGPLGEILRDADKLDAMGAVGLMRAFSSKYMKSEYESQDVKGHTWGLTMADFEKRFARGMGIGDTIVDQVNFQISFYSDLNTQTAKQFGWPMVEFMRGFVKQLASELQRNVK